MPSSTCCTGKVHLLSGMDGATLLELTGPAPLGFFGHSVAGPGDVTGDGVPDFLVGGGGAAGGLYSGATGSLVYSLFPLGWNVGAPGDTNSDGVPDLLVGDPTFGGAIFSGLAASLLQSLPGGGCQQIGFTVAGIGDVDGDGAGDVVLGAPNMSGCSFPTPGTAHVHSGGTGNLLAIVSGPTGFNSVFGRTVSGLGDVTGDGVPDFAVSGTQGTVGGPTLYAGIWVFSGANSSLATLLTNTTEAIGISLAGPGDVDGDGVPDLLAGSPYAPPAYLVGPSPSYAGRALLFSGSDWTGIYNLTPPPGEFLTQGGSVCGSEDVNGDDFPDLAVGAAGSIAFVIGKVRLYSGSPTGVSSFGVGCAGAAGTVPRIGATRAPKVGTVFKINLSRTGPAQGALLMLGFSNAAWWGIPLPLDLGFAGLPGCALGVSPDFVVGLTTEPCGPGKGRAVAPLALPAAPSLVGTPFYAQWYVADPGSAPIPGGMTRGLAVVLQP
ncbi:MAG TPA: VCBS repeat-containing protein [Planctomycetota bacterium]|nr:VCBS repeat-containing protein [Planctomycetota bacterium]